MKSSNEFNTQTLPPKKEKIARTERDETEILSAILKILKKRSAFPIKAQITNASGILNEINSAEEKTDFKITETALKKALISLNNRGLIEPITEKSDSANTDYKVTDIGLELLDENIISPSEGAKKNRTVMHPYNRRDI